MHYVLFVLIHMHVSVYQVYAAKRDAAVYLDDGDEDKNDDIDVKVDALDDDDDGDDKEAAGRGGKKASRISAEKSRKQRERLAAFNGEYAGLPPTVYRNAIGFIFVRDALAFTSPRIDMVRTHLHGDGCSRSADISDVFSAQCPFPAKMSRINMNRTGISHDTPN